MLQSAVLLGFPRLEQKQDNALIGINNMPSRVRYYLFFLFAPILRH